MLSPNYCPVCDSAYVIEDEGRSYFCVTCEARKALAESKLPANDRGKLVSYTDKHGQLVLLAPLGSFVVTCEPATISEPCTRDEKSYKPTDLPPGSAAKLRLLRQRYQQGLPIFHAEDRDAWNGTQSRGIPALLATLDAQRSPDKDAVFASEAQDLEREVREHGLAI